MLSAVGGRRAALEVALERVGLEHDRPRAQPSPRYPQRERAEAAAQHEPEPDPTKHVLAHARAAHPHRAAPRLELYRVEVHGAPREPQRAAQHPAHERARAGADQPYEHLSEATAGVARHRGRSRFDGNLPGVFRPGSRSTGQRRCPVRAALRACRAGVRHGHPPRKHPPRLRRRRRGRKTGEVTFCTVSANASRRPQARARSSAIPSATEEVESCNVRWVDVASIGSHGGSAWPGSATSRA